MKEFVCLYSIDAYDGGCAPAKARHGFLFADNFVDAVQQLENDLYGSDLVKINELELYDSIAEVSPATYTALKKELAL